MGEACARRTFAANYGLLIVADLNLRTPSASRRKSAKRGAISRYHALGLFEASCANRCRVAENARYLIADSTC